MKLANDALVAIIGVFRKGLTEGTDVSELLRNIDLVQDASGRLALNPNHEDIWTPRKFD
jgi:hypothetical protein